MDKPCIIKLVKPSQGEKLNILHIIFGDLEGGAAKGALLLHEAQRKRGVKSFILTNAQSNTNKNIYSVSKNFFVKIIIYSKYYFFRLLTKFYIHRNKNALFNSGFDGIDITKYDIYKNSDIIHLHWINGLVNISSLKKIKKPIVWTVRDLWPVTGGCHHNINPINYIECTSYQSHCKKCPQLNSSSNFDLSYYIFRNKLNHYPKNMHLVGTSSWTLEKIKKSKLFKDHYSSHIPNLINLKNFYPDKKKDAQLKLGIKTKKKIILLGAQRFSDTWKGSKLLLQFLKKIDVSNYFFLIIGELDIDLSQVQIEYKHMGYIKNDNIMRTIYSASNIFLSTSIIESFGKMIAEALACGTPVVCFNTSGPSSIVKHQTTGYLANPYDVTDLVNGVHFISKLSTKDQKGIQSNACNDIRRIIDEDSIIKKYNSVYESIMN